MKVSSTARDDECPWLTWPGIDHLHITPRLGAVADARSWLRTVLQAGGVPEQHHARVVLAASELIANAVEHAQPPIVLVSRVDARLVRIEVYDGTPRPPRRRPISADNHRGNGLRIVEQAMSRWGTTSADHSKAVWCELGFTSEAWDED